MFLSGRIDFIDIQNTLERVMEEHVPEHGLDIEGVLEADKRIRDEMRSLF